MLFAMRILIALFLMTTPALADQTLAGKTVDCYCTDSNGKRVEMGEMICLHVGGRSFMAQCQMSLNNPMWREISQGCLSSSLRERLQPAVDAGGVHPKI